MPVDNQLSTVLLLVALGLLIYCLTKPDNNLKEQDEEQNKNQDNEHKVQDSKYNKCESFESISDKIKQLSQNQIGNLQEKIPQVLQQPSPPVTVTQPPVTVTPPPVSSQQPVDTYIDPKTINEIIDSSNKDNKSVSDFDALDNEYGAELDNAFVRPIPQQTNSSEVPLNKNNLKKYDSKDYLPKELNDTWFDTDFSQAKYNVNDDKLINTERYVIGINTVGQSLKNASYDMRGTIANPKFTVSPWNNSTYEPDYNIKTCL
jgi:hypothetical protein